MLTMDQTQSKKFHCIYRLQFYPFDSQICTVDFQLERFTQRSVKLVASSIEMLSATELTQYTIKTWTLEEGKILIRQYYSKVKTFWC